MKLGTTLGHFIIAEQTKYRDASGNLSSLLSQIGTAGKIISREVNKAGLVDIIGAHGDTNVHGEAVQKLDLYANEVFLKHLSHTGHLAGIASEEMEELYPIPENAENGNYVFLMDPLDGSSNIDVNISIGSIFSIYRRKKYGTAVCLEDFLQTGREQVCAGYILYGSSTMLVYSTGHGVHGFTLDPGIGEFLLSHERIEIPAQGNIYSLNEAYEPLWDEGVRRYVQHAKSEHKTARYVGSLVADFHRNLLKGGVFVYPADRKHPKGKLRLMYEASPLAFIVEQAKGKASDGETAILDIVPDELHQRIPLVIGSAKDVDAVENCFAGKTNIPQ